MSVSLVKGGNVSLTKEVPGLESVVVGQGFDGGLGVLARNYGVNI